MRVHSAVWVLAANNGNDRARKYAQDRKSLSNRDQLVRDSKWLRGHGGVRLRKLWFDLTLQEREDLMKDHPDPTFPERTNGVLDERRKSGRYSRSWTRSPLESTGDEPRCPLEEAPSVQGDREIFRPLQEVESPKRFSIMSSTQHDSYRSLYRLRESKVKYYSTVIKEERVLAQIAYDSGNMSGVLKSVMRSVENAIQLGRICDSPEFAHEAFVSVATRMTDLFAAFNGMIRFEPEPLSADEAPSAAFAQARMSASKAKYLQALREAQATMAIVPEPPLLLHPLKYFGNIE